MENYTIKISEKNVKTKALIQYLKTLDFIELKKEINLKDQDDQQFKEIEQVHIPDWQINEVRERIEDYKNNPDKAIDFDTAMEDIEKDL